MAGVSQQRLQFIFWYLLSICTFVAANSNNTCEVLCLCSVPQDYWNQLKCCPKLLVQKEIASAQDINSESNSPVADADPMSDSPVDGGLMYDSPPDGGSMYDSPPDDGSLYDSPVDGGPMSSHKSSCVYSFVYTEPLHKDFYYAYPFRVFHSCLQMFIGSEMYLKCQNFRNVSCLECIIPVVDRKTKIIYANRFCAECNAIEDIETFNHEFKCSSEILGRWDLLSLEQTEENNIVLFRSGLCVYFLAPPDWETLQTAGNSCLMAKYTNCYHAEEVAVSKFDWYDYKWSNRYLEDGEYCALCGYPSAMPEYPDFGQSESNTVQGACNYRKVQVGKDQEKAQSEKDSHSKNRGGKKPN